MGMEMCYDLLFKVYMHAFPLCGLGLAYASNQHLQEVKKWIGVLSSFSTELASNTDMWRGVCRPHTLSLSPSPSLHPHLPPPLPPSLLLDSS